VGGWVGRRDGRRERGNKVRIRSGGSISNENGSLGGREVGREGLN